MHRLFDVAGAVVLMSSTIYTLFPPWESFKDYPRFQKAYRFVMIFVVRFASINLRSVVYPKIQATAQDALEPKGEK